MKVTGSVKFRRPKLSPQDKALRKVLRPIAREIASQMKGAAPKLTGALRTSISQKVIPQKRGRCAAIVGVRNTYSKKVKGKLKIPNLYARKIDKRTNFLGRANLHAYMDRIKREVGEEVARMLEGN